MSSFITYSELGATHRNVRLLTHPAKLKQEEFSPMTFAFENHTYWAGAMAPCLRALVALTEDPGSIPSTHMGALQPSVIQVLGDPMPSSDLSGH